jgi:hypothetical protein
MRITFIGVLAVISTALVLWIVYSAYMKQQPPNEGPQR